MRIRYAFLHGGAMAPLLRQVYGFFSGSAFSKNNPLSQLLLSTSLVPIRSHSIRDQISILAHSNRVSKVLLVTAPSEE